MTTAHDPDDTFLAGRFQRRKYKALEAQGDAAARDELGRFLVQRFEERFFAPLRAIPEPQKDAFTLMAVGCLVVETLQAFRRGCEDTNGASAKMFSLCFAEDTPLKVFASTPQSIALGLGEGWFYTHIRCGILHEGEARGGWRLLRYGPTLCDLDARTINAQMFVDELERQVKGFGKLLATNEHEWQMFKKKMVRVCENCEAKATPLARSRVKC